MKAPDKIYVYIPQRLNMSTFKEDSKYVGMAYTDKKGNTPSQIEEYIRKEALLEWLIEKYNGYTEKMFEKNMDETHWGQRNAFQQVIDKLNSL